MASFDVVITVNSPGEVATWLQPVMAALAPQRKPTMRMVVLITPCVYASGTEMSVVEAIAGVDVVLSPRESFAYALWGRCPTRWQPAPKGALLHLGGEFILSARMARRLGYDAFAYTEGFVNRASTFRRLFLPYEHLSDRVAGRGATADQVEVVGNLMVDAAWGDSQHGASNADALTASPADDGLTVGLFPGSRPHEVRYATNFFLTAAAALEQRVDGVNFTVVLSPFVTDALWDEARAMAAAEPSRWTVWRGPSRDVMPNLDVAMTIPGSVNAELAARGVAHVVALPLDKPEDIPLDGLAGYVDRVPFIGKRLKRAAVLNIAHRTPLVAPPNRIAGEMLVPELKSETLTPDDVAEATARLLQDETARGRLAQRLVEVMGPRGAARNIVRWLLERAEAGNVGR